MNQEGMIPITKNVTVLRVDSSPFSMTYPKRAKHLVKKGRARWKDENTIELTESSPSIDMEDEWNMENELKQKAFEFIVSSDVDPLIKNDQIIRLIEGQDNTVELFNRLIEELRNAIPVMNTDIPIYISAIEGVEDADSEQKLEVLKEVSFKSLEIKAEIVSRLENIVRCIVDARSIAR